MAEQNNQGNNQGNNNNNDPNEVFAANPFATNINPATTQGLKLWQAATASREDADKLVLKFRKLKSSLTL